MIKKTQISIFSVYAVAALLLTLVGGCATSGQTGALVGGGLGAITGQLIGATTGSTLAGAAIGTGIGYIIGNEADKKKAEKMSQASKSANYNHQEVAPLGGTKWKVIDIAPKDRAPKFASKTLEFGPEGHLTTRTTLADGKKQVDIENYRVVGDIIIINKPGYLVKRFFVRLLFFLYRNTQGQNNTYIIFLRDI